MTEKLLHGDREVESSRNDTDEFRHGVMAWGSPPLLPCVCQPLSGRIPGAANRLMGKYFRTSGLSILTFR